MAEHPTRLNPVPAVTAAQMREVDRIMVEDLGVSLWPADISVPAVAHAASGIQPGALFAESDLIQIRRS